MKSEQLRIMVGVLIIAFLWSGMACAGEVMIAVANNFYRPMKQLAIDFKDVTGHDASLATGSTGQLYAQITHGAPFEVLLSADTARPDKLVASGLASNQFTYAQGVLALWSTQPALIDKQGEVLSSGNFRHLAMADPKLAPYGLAAKQVLENKGLFDRVKPKIVTGKGLNPTYQFIYSGNADLGFVALSQIYQNGAYQPGSYWLVPEKLYTSISQDAVLLNQGQDNPAAHSFMEYLSSDRAKALIEQFGYKTALSE